MENLNSMPAVEFIKVAENAILPTKAHPTDTGYDLYCTVPTVVPAMGQAVVPVGIKVGYIPDGYWFKIESRSGLSFKSNLLAHPGVIDNGYRGDLGVKMYNHGKTDYTFNPGDRVAQMAFYFNLNLDVKWGTEAKAADRGEKGHGSSGK